MSDKDTTSLRPVNNIDERAERLSQLLETFIDEAVAKTKRARRWQKFWQTAHVAFGLPAAVLAGISGLTGLMSTAGRVPAAILSLIAAGCAAASSFLQCEAKGEKAGRRKNAWRVLDADTRLALAQAYGDTHALTNVLERLRDRRALLLNGDFDGAMQLPTGAKAAAGR